MCMDRATLCRVDAGRVDAGMTEDVSQPGKVMVDEVEQPDKKMPQIMGEHFSFCYPGITTQMFHLCPNLCPAQGPSRSCAKNRTSRYVQFTRILQ